MNGVPTLADLRKAKGLTQEEVADAVGISTISVSRHERGESAPKKARTRRAYARLYAVSLATINRIFDNVEDDGVNDDEDEHRLAPEWMSAYLAFERSAASVEAYEPFVVNGLLQTESYARALIGQAEPSDKQVDRLVRLRMSRQEAVLRADDPLDLLVVQGEGAIRLTVGGRHVMREQITHLVDVASMPNVTIRMLPFSAGPHMADKGSFIFLRPPWEESPSVVYVEQYFRGANYIEKKGEIKPFAELWAEIRAWCPSADESVEIIRELGEELYG